MNTPSLRKLDDVLKIIIKIGHHARQREIDEKYQERYPSDTVDIWDILEKLQDDRYIKKSKDYEEGFAGLEEFEYSYYKIRFEGLVFLEQGGYEGKVQKTNSEIALNKTIQYILAVVGSISALFYISEASKTSLGGFTLVMGLLFAEITSFYYFFFKKKEVSSTLLVLVSFVLVLVVSIWIIKKVA